MARSRVLSVAFVVVLVLGSGTQGAVAMDPPEGQALQQNVEPDLVNLGVSLQEDGSATWEIEYRVRLQTDNETRAFEDLIADVEANRSAYLDRFSDRINGTVDNAAESTGREMAAADFQVSARIGTLGRYGILTYTFTWSNFATVSGETMTAGDALEGFFLDEDTTLELSWPQDYQLSGVSPEPTSTRDNAVIWRGPMDFADGEPSLAVEYAPSATATTTAPTQDTTPTTESPESGSVWLWMVGGLGALGLLGGGLWYWTRREEESPGDRAAAAPTAPDEETPAELLSNEERVEEYLESHGGRAKQQEIVDGLEWTEAKTSQVLSSMQEEGRIDKFRIGRENVVKLPGSEDDGE